jgi:prepilin-type N-terminal cleavage/methylation domain-containing protein
MRNRGFTLIELLVIITIMGIIAGITIPHMTSHVGDVKESSLEANLGVIRKAIEIFHMEHNGTYPGFPNGAAGGAPTENDFRNQMLQKTDRDCSVNPDGPCGPYLRPGFPFNPMNKKAAILVGQDSVTDPGLDSDFGWYYRASTGEFYAVTEEDGETQEEVQPQLGGDALPMPY